MFEQQVCRFHNFFERFLGGKHINWIGTLITVSDEGFDELLDPIAFLTRCYR